MTTQLSPLGHPSKLKRFGARLAFLATAFLGLATPATAGATGTPIAALPYYISSPGRYYLANDLVLPAGNSSAITIAADGVTVDLNGCRLSANPTNSIVTAGIGSTNHKNLIIMNGTISGFADSVAIGSTSPATRPNHNIVIRDLTIAGPELSATSTPMGIYVNGGSGVLVKNVDLDGFAGGTPYGLYVQNSDFVRVLEVNIGQVYGVSVSGIYLNACNDFIVQNCVVDHASGGPGAYSPGSGINITATCMAGHVMDNRIVNGNLTITSLYTMYGNNMVGTGGGGYFTQGIDAGNNH